MDQNPTLVGPRDDPLVPKARSKQLLDLMKALSLVKDFTIQLGNTAISESIKLNLGRVASIFSPDSQNRPNTNEEIADIKSLYHGKKARLLMQQRLLQVPWEKRAYHRHTHQVSASSPNVAYSVSNSILDKRKRKREHLVSDDVTLDSRNDLEARLARMEARIAELEASREENREEEVANQVGVLLDDFIYSDRLEDMVETIVEDRMGHLNIDMDEIFGEKKDEFDETLEELKQDVMKDCRKIVLEEIKRHIAELIDTRLELSFKKKEL